MDDIQTKREAVKSVYKAPAWASKVNKMSDAQILAIWQRFRNNKKL